MIVRLMEVDSNGNLNITPEALMIREFRNVWEKYSDKKQALEELAYVYWMAYYNSTYDVYLSIEEKKAAIKADIITDPLWMPDELTEAAIQKFSLLQRTFAMAFLEAAKEGALKIRKFYKDVDLNERSKNGGVIYKPTDISKAIKESIDILESLEKWQERVKKEAELGDTRIKGGGKAGAFENEFDADAWMEETTV